MDYFGELYYRCFKTKLEERAEEETRRAIELMDKPKTVLDVGCGWGRHLHYLLNWGIDAWGIEPNPFFVEVFRERYPMWKDRIIQTTLQDAYVFKQFGAVLSLWTSIGWDESASAEESLFDKFSQFLLPGGQLLIDVDNLQGWQAHFCKRWWERVEGGYVLDKHDLRGNILTTNRLFLLGDSQYNVRRQLKLYSLDELQNMAEDHELFLKMAYRDLTGNPFQKESARIVAVFEKISAA
ncbi:class I SAM-dependent methyltransferase [Coprothermobacter platensis]|uniref:class I SAM-dependent methyltransferase n=1 Tax=Coprothermobacter platensis TaxID=108819 RepID=UPI0003672A9E|nr:class I SAM-dependent methyltransferase [Coprothermobacter platensis]